MSEERERRDGSSPWRDLWDLDPTVAYLNHGSFGACPRAVLAAQQRLRDELEREPVEFFLGSYLERLDESRAALAAFVGSDADDLALVNNATTGVNTVLRSLRLGLGDEIVVTDQEYNACRNALDQVARQAAARIVVARIPFPIEDPEQAVVAILSAVTERTRLVMIDHVVSSTGLVLPIETIVGALNGEGIDTLVDGAHAPGTLGLDLKSLGATYYAANCHKWLCTPKGAAFLYVRRDRQPAVHPLVISHGANAEASKRSRFRLEFDWAGTDDPTAWLSIPEALRYLASLVPGGWPEIRERNRALALEGRDILCEALAVERPCPDEMIGTLAAVPLSDGPAEPPTSAMTSHPLRDQLYRRYRIEVPIIAWPAPPARLVRISAQLYNSREQYEYLAHALCELLDRG